MNISQEAACTRLKCSLGSDLAPGCNSWKTKKVSKETGHPTSPVTA